VKIREIGELVGMNYHATGELVRRFEKDVKVSEKLQKLIAEIEI